MRLYKMELYKLLRRKIFLVSLVMGVLLLLIYFWFVNVGDERTTIRGKTCTGYEAVQTDRKITEEFRGIFTDETARKIIAEYGFPSKVEEYYGGFRDENYLNGFVTQYLGNGYFRDWNDYRISDDLYPLSQTELGRVTELTGKEIFLDYTRGWSAFLDTLQLGMIFGSVLILLGISPVFAEEKQCRMASLIFTSEEGVRKDVMAKITASFTLAVLVYAVMASGAALMTGSVYGFGGGECMSGILMTRMLNAVNPVTTIPIWRYTAVVLVLSFLGLLSLCAAVLCVSAHYASSFHAVSVSCIVWLSPLLIRILFGGAGYLLVSGSPLFLIMYGIVDDWYQMVFIPAGIAAGTAVFCTVNGWKTYRMAEICS